LDWKGVLLSRLTIPTSAEYGPQFTGMPVLFASRFSPGRRWLTCNGKTQEVPLIAPGVDLLSSTYERDHERWECAPGGETICVRMHPLVIERCIQENACHFDLETRYSQQDELLVQSIFALAQELQGGMPNGRLFAEGLSLALIGLISHHHTRAHRSLRHAGALTTTQQTRIREFIDAHLDTDLSIDRLASEVHISPFHFARLFRSTFDMPPHRYVMQMRIARAARFLHTDQHRTIMDIALATGFASHAHFTRAFKCHMGKTPASWRRT
jgi:AraC family transcriptional regulator